MKIAAPSASPQPSSPLTRLQAAAVELEATFLAEMLKSAGLGETRKTFGGGAGEDQFSTFLVQHQAKQLALSGGVGLSEILLKAMMENTDSD